MTCIGLSAFPGYSDVIFHKQSKIIVSFTIILDVNPQKLCIRSPLFAQSPIDSVDNDQETRMAAEEVSQRSLVATVRYDDFEDTDVFYDTFKWIRVEAVWNSKRRFCRKVSMPEFIVACQSNHRLQVYIDYNQEAWVRRT